jgi:hypothetical protein
MKRLPGASDEDKRKALREEVERFFTMLLFLIAVIISLASSSKK